MADRIQSAGASLILPSVEFSSNDELILMGCRSFYTGLDEELPFFGVDGGIRVVGGWSDRGFGFFWRMLHRSRKCYYKLRGFIVLDPRVANSKRLFKYIK